MKKIKFVGAVVFFVAVAYIFLTTLMPFISDTASEAATEVSGSPYASSYVGAEEGVEYMPLVLYFVPGALGVTLIVLRLKTNVLGD